MAKTGPKKTDTAGTTPKTAKPRKNAENYNESRLTKLGINFSLNAQEEALFHAVNTLLNITKGAKKEVFLTALKEVYANKTGKDPVKVFEL